MRTLSGQYELEHDVAAFFCARTLKFVMHDSYVTGRFGREGAIRGSVTGNELLAQWHDKKRHGWMRVRFAPSFKTAELEYGMNDSGEALGRSMMVRVVRSARRLASQ
jgi:hypothetical protein